MHWGFSDTVDYARLRVMWVCSVQCSPTLHMHAIISPVDAEAVGCGSRSADQECASGFFPLSTPLGFFLPVALLFACALLVVACDLLIAPCYGRSLVAFSSPYACPFWGLNVFGILARSLG
jgi:hypothetical protein